MSQLKPSVFSVIQMLILSISALWAHCVCSAQLVGGDLEFPYQALVLRDGASIQSGPGQVHYPTQRLKQGDAVEVYRHDPGGWCAIRPVAGSFSLVPESTLELVGDGVGKITQDGTQAWVGTELDAVDKPLWQVKLRKGEMVEVLGQVSWPEPEGHSTLWYQIASPAGEFRWIRMSEIQLPVASNLTQWDEPLTDPSTTNPSTTGPSTPDPSKTVRSLNEVIAGSPALDQTNPVWSTNPAVGGNSNPSTHEGRQASYQSQSASKIGKTETKVQSINGGWRQATRPINKNISGSELGYSSSGTPNASSSMGFNSKAYNPREFEGQWSDRQNPALTAGSVRVANVDSAPLNLASNLNAARRLANAQPGTTPDRVRDLEFRLSNEMVKNDPSKWYLDDLESAANSIKRNSYDVGERSSAEKFLNKIANCRAIQAGYRTGLGIGSNGSAADSTRPVGTGVSRQLEIDASYDAHGWLNKMVRNGGSSESTYILQDKNGKVTHHISPIPGLNLQRYLKSHVGIIGQRGYHSQLKLAHVTAHRIVEFDDQR